MNFQDLLKVEKADFYIDLSLRKGREAAERVKKTKTKIERIDKARRIELARLDSVREVSTSALEKIVKSFPSIDDLPEFYKELIRTTLDYGQLKKSLGAVNWAKERIKILHRDYGRKIKNARDFGDIPRIKGEFVGRFSSVLKQIKAELAYLDDSRRTMKGYPAVKDLPTVAIAGFPNVGKSTLLSRLTTATPDIANYSFTTRKLNFGPADFNGRKIQMVDTPGTLNRFEKMNYIERQAEIALKYLAKIIIFVFDPTEGYSIDEQKKLFLHVKRLEKPMIVYVSKTDIADKAVAEVLTKRFHAVPFEKLKSEILRKLDE